jgi:hypothetical protein
MLLGLPHQHLENHCLLFLPRSHQDPLALHNGREASCLVRLGAKLEAWLALIDVKKLQHPSGGWV